MSLPSSNFEEHVRIHELSLHQVDSCGPERDNLPTKSFDAHFGDRSSSIARHSTTLDAQGKHIIENIFRTMSASTKKDFLELEEELSTDAPDHLLGEHSTHPLLPSFFEKGSGFFSHDQKTTAEGIRIGVYGLSYLHPDNGI